MLISACGSRSGSCRRMNECPASGLPVPPPSLPFCQLPFPTVWQTCSEQPCFPLLFSLSAFLSNAGEGFSFYPLKNFPSIHWNSISLKTGMMALVQMPASDIFFPHKIIQKLKGIKVSINSVSNVNFKTANNDSLEPPKHFRRTTWHVAWSLKFMKASLFKCKCKQQ